MRYGAGTRSLHVLAQLHRIQTSYRDVTGRRVAVPEPTLLALLGALGVRIDSSVDCRDAVREERLRRSAELIEPVLVAWDGTIAPFELRLRADESPSIRFSITAEDGTETPLEGASVTLRETGLVECEGLRYRSMQARVNTPLPSGYHILSCSTRARSATAHLLAAPRHAYRPPKELRRWGLFLPLYALRTESDWGTGSYTDLARLVAWTAQAGGHFLGTLPLLPCFHGPAGETSPYLPVTRLLWSEFFVDVTSAPNLADCGEAQELLQSASLLQARDAVHHSALVDYSAVWRLKRAVLQALARQALDNGNGWRGALQEFLRTHPLVSDYAAFRSASETHARPWREWEPPASRGDLSHFDLEPGAVGFYEYAQWVADLQMSCATSKSGEAETGLYLDLPLGVDPNGYDAWRYRECFLSGASCGAPPDVLFTTGQNWGSPPLHPEVIRRRGYDYFRAVLDHHMQRSAALRIDHVMGLHRIFCIPAGGTSAMGTYLRYRPQEMYAVLSIESNRHRTVLVGEDLGTVPLEVRREMARHRLNRMFVVHYELEGMGERPGLHVPRECMATLNTHDMPPFAAMWNGLDICQHAELGIVASSDVPAATEKRRRLKRALLSLLPCHLETEEARVRDVLRCTLEWLGKQKARYMLVNLEDLWLETRQPNVPGIGAAYPSWRHRAALTLEQLSNSPDISDLLGIVRRSREERPGGGR